MSYSKNNYLLINLFILKIIVIINNVNNNNKYMNNTFNLIMKRIQIIILTIIMKMKLSYFLFLSLIIQSLKIK